MLDTKLHDFSLPATSGKSFNLAEQAGKARGGNADGAGIGPPEQGGGLVAHRDVDQIARHDARLAEGLLVGDEADFVVGATLDEIVGDLRQPLLGELAQIIASDVFVSVPAGLVGALNDPCVRAGYTHPNSDTQ